MRLRRRAHRVLRAVSAANMIREDGAFALPNRLGESLLLPSQQQREDSVAGFGSDATRVLCWRTGLVLEVRRCQQRGFRSRTMEVSRHVPGQVSKQSQGYPRAASRSRQVAVTNGNECIGTNGDIKSWEWSGLRCNDASECAFGCVC